MLEIKIKVRNNAVASGIVKDKPDLIETSLAIAEIEKIKLQLLSLDFDGDIEIGE